MENKVATEIAIREVRDFLETYEFGKRKEDWQIENDYPQIVRAIELGNLTFNEKKVPTFKLTEPITNDDGEVSVSEITFKTRIKPTTLADIMKGVDLSKNQLEYSLRCIAYLTGQAKGMLDKIGKFDYKVIDQVSTVFL
jgi:hypothetical protein